MSASSPDRGASRRGVPASYGAAAVVSAWLTLGIGPVHGQPAPEVLAVGTFWIHAQAEAPFRHEIERLDVVCAGQAACLKQRLRPTVRRLASLHGEPSLVSAVVGYVVARLAVDDAGELAIALDVERADGADARAPWIAAVPDWENGIELPGVRGRGDGMLEVTGLPFVDAAWMLRSGPDWSIRMTRRPEQPRSPW